MMLIPHSVNSEGLFNIQSRVLLADGLILENNEKATFNINIPYSDGQVTTLSIGVAAIFLSVFPQMLYLTQSSFLL